MSEEKETLASIIAEGQEWDRTKGAAIRESYKLSAGGSSSLAAILACVGLTIGAFAGADTGGLAPAIGAIVGCTIGFLVGKSITFGFRFIGELWSSGWSSTRRTKSSRYKSRFGPG